MVVLLQAQIKVWSSANGIQLRKVPRNIETIFKYFEFESEFLINCKLCRYEAFFIQPSENISSKFAKPFQVDLIACFLVIIFIISVIYIGLNDYNTSLLCIPRRRSSSVNRPLNIRRSLYEGFCYVMCKWLDEWFNCTNINYYLFWRE